MQVVIYVVTERGNSYGPIMERIIRSMSLPYEFSVSQLTMADPQPTIEPVKRLMDTYYPNHENESSQPTRDLPQMPSIIVAPVFDTARRMMTRAINEYGHIAKHDIKAITLTDVYGEIMPDTPAITYEDWLRFHTDFLHTKAQLAHKLAFLLEPDEEEYGDEEDVESAASFADLIQMAGEVEYLPHVAILAVAQYLPHILLDVFGDRPDDDKNRLLRKALSVGLLSMAEETLLVLGIPVEYGDDDQ